MSDAIEIYKGDHAAFDPIGAMRFRAKAMFAKSITRDEFTSMQAQLTRIEEKLSDIKIDNSHLSTEVSAVHAIALEIGTKTYNALAALEAKVDILGAKEIIVTPPSVIITGGPNSKKLILVSQPANSKAIFVAESSDTSIVTVTPAMPGPSTGPNSFIVTEVAPGSAVIRISDNAVPITNTANVNVIAS
jgi:hypothetical protein